MNELWIEIARTGNFKDSQGREQIFTSERLNKIAVSYNPKNYEAPLVIGHPQTDSPAYGWFSELKIDGDILKGKLGKPDIQIINLVSNGHYKRVSMSLFENDSLKHVGLLGAAAPAITGLKPVEFNKDEKFTSIDFSQNNLKKGESMNEELIKRLESELARLKNDLAEEKSKNEALEKELAEIKAEAQKTVSEFSAYKSKHEQELIEAKIGELIQNGRILPAEKDSVLETAKNLHSLCQIKNFSSSENNPLDNYLKSFDKKPHNGLLQNFSAPTTNLAEKTFQPISAKL